MKMRYFLPAIILCFLMAGCRVEAAQGSTQAGSEETAAAGTQESAAAAASRDTGFTVWSTYWDTSRTDVEFQQIESAVKNLCYFEVYYDEKLNYIYPDELKQQWDSQKSRLSELGVTSYVTFVNDLKQSEQPASLKDVELLHRLLDTDTAREQQAQRMVQFAKSNGFQGIEVDYEKIRSDRELWKYFGDFLTVLNQKAEKEGLKLRILLEPQTPADVVLPQEPTYVMMCYNLFGSGTEPGPKANREFLLKMAGLMQGLSAKRDFALATGGYDFTIGGSAAQVTEQEADMLKAEYHASAVRDADSGVNWFNYQEANGIRHQVWYADGKTLSHWIQILKEAGENDISLWRLGGNLTLGELAK